MESDGFRRNIIDRKCRRMKVNAHKSPLRGALAEIASDIVIRGGKIAGRVDGEELHWMPRQAKRHGRKSILTNDDDYATIS